MATHALLSPSKTAQWMNCPASIALEHQLGLDTQDSSSEFADEGTAAHAVASSCLESGEETTKAWVGEEVNVFNDDGTLRRTFTCTQDMADYIQLYLDEVRRRVGPGDTLLVEQRVSLHRTMGMPEQGGTADAIIVHADGRVTIIDLKYGAGIKVYVQGNTQALSYACGVLETFDMLYDFTAVQLVIVQPRMDNIAELPEWLSIEEVNEHGRKMRNAALNVNIALEQVAYKRPISEDLFAPSKYACQWCRAKHSCDALARHTLKEVSAEFSVIPLDDALQAIAADSTPLAVPSNARIGRAFAALPLLEMWIKAVRLEVNRQVYAGMVVDGPDGLPFKLVDGGLGDRKWADKDKAEAMLVGQLPPDKVYKPREIITAPQAGKLLDKKKTAAIWEQFKPLITRAPAGPIVALGSDPRPVYSANSTAAEFQQIDLAVAETE